MARSTVRDIAARAGVSPATVSNALNGRPGVSRAVAQKVQRIAQEMGYLQPHDRQSEERGKYAFVRLVIYKSHGMVVMDTIFFAELIEGIQKECQKAGMELVVTHISAGEEGCAQRIRDVCQEENEGVLLLGTEMDREEAALFKDCRSPLVVLDNVMRHQALHSVSIDNYEAGYMAVNALYDAGYRHIGHITSSVAFSNAWDRRKGFKAGMRAHGLMVPPEAIWAVRPSIDGAYEDVKALLDAGRRPPDACFAANDLMAIGAIRALTERGFRVPEDVSFIGMDDTAVCLACTPTLTTLRVSRREMSAAAVRMLLSVVPGMKQSALKTAVGVSLVVRESVRGMRQ